MRSGISVWKRMRDNLSVAIVFVAALLFLILTFVLGLEDMRDELLINAVIYLMLIAVMMIFDRALDYMLLFYERRLRKRLIRKG